MDFASLMSKEIAKAKGPSTNDEDKKNSSTQKKYVSRREAEADREAAYHAEQAAIEERRATKAAEKRKREEDEAEERAQREEKKLRLQEESRRRREQREAEEERARRKRLGLPELPDKDAQAAGVGGDEAGLKEGEEDIPDADLVSKLRELGEPAILFGETHGRRLRRYRRLTTAVTKGPIPTTLLLVEEADMKVCSPEDVPSDKEGRQYLFRQLASYFTLVLREWERALAAEHSSNGKDGDRPGGDTSFAGKAAVNAMLSSRDNMKPLFRKFESGALDDDILKPVVEIVGAAQSRRYVDANDGYLRLSIGKAAWPIGVTMVGIHERSAREKLHGGDSRGHVMGDEVTRKYLQAIKRCLTFAQVRWPPEDIRQLMG